MMRCEEVRASLQLYVDSEIEARDEVRLEAHLLDCEDCRRAYDTLRNVVDTVRGSTPLYEPPSTLRNSVEAIIREAAPAKTPRLPIRMAAAIAAALVLLMLGSPARERGVSFESFASEAHMRHATGRMPLDISSSDQNFVFGWLNQRMPFHLGMPESIKGYTVSGARMLQYGGGDAAYLAYTVKNRPVSLLVSTSDRIRPSGDEVQRSGKLVFHISRRNGLKVITWRDGDLVYSLVSDVALSNLESCVVCHGPDSQRLRFE